MEPKRTTRAPSNETATETSETKQSGDETKSSSTPHTAVDLLRADHQALMQALAHYQGASDASDQVKPALTTEVYTLAMHHFDVEETVLKALAKAGTPEGRIREFLVWHDIARVLIADLHAGHQSAPALAAKQAALHRLVNEMIAREEDAENGVFALIASAGLESQGIASKIQARKRELTQQAEHQQTYEPALSTLRLNAFSRTNRQTLEDHSMDRHYNTDRRRDEEGRFMSQNGSRGERYGRDRDDYRGEEYRGNEHRGNEGRGWYGDSERHSEASHRGWESRDNGRYDDRDAGRYGERDDYRSISSRYEDADRSYRGSSNRSNERPRDENGRFVSDEDHSGSRRSFDDDRHTGYGRSSYGEGGRSERNHDEDTRYGRSQGRNHDEDHRYSRGNDRHRDENGRFASDDDRGSRGRSSDDRESHSGWFGDSRGHSEASRRGWETRRG